ncbi:MAG: YraN family protein [Pseudomonadaceae bacterium]|nr:YraN family protein [Pseudomonadaceae bacterium]
MPARVPALARLVNCLHPHTKGWLAEKLAFFYLLTHGYLPARRPTTAHVQTDLLLCRGRILLLVEVKYRPTATAAALAISPTQRARLTREARRLAALYPAYALRADIIAVFPRWPFLSHLPSAIALD